MQNEDSEKGGGVAALDRAFAILGAFESGEKGVSLADLARRTGYYKSTLLRLLGALDHGGFVRKLEDGRYSVGPEPLRLAQIYQESFHVRHVVEPLLQQLAIDSGETSSFYVRQGSHRIVLHRVEPARAVRVSIREGERFPIDRGASGKVLLAFSRPYKKGFDDVRERMWAVSYGERDPDTASVSVPVLGLGGELVGALTVSGPRERIGAIESMRAACKLLLSASARASAALGGDPSMFAASVKLADQNDFAAP
ncbi:IclR family transcriptional regulator [Paraburkholderia bryophila]|uniref:IclR family transcriptional regulator n=1 Tax=Paraburkholderia bryophila TaxID=420952 RepID=UPI0023497B2A|nr:IclR family transcriptional regulator [Paraburkholderia bryophila]WCM22857.1 IclR family transcriptional regulator [Paraburkholderia bryophila]